MSSITLTPLERKAYDLIKKSGKKGILQNELWRRLGVDSREGSRIALKLVKRGLIEREPVVHNGKRTYRLFLKKKEELLYKIKLDGVLDIPCFTCPHYTRCSSGGYINPATCDKLTEWIIRNVYGRRGEEKEN